MAKAFGVRGFDDIFKEFYGKDYQTFQFKRPGFFAGGIFFTGPFGKPRSDPSLLSSSGKLGKLSSFFLKQISGFELQKNGNDIHDVIRLTPTQAQEGGPYAYFLRKKSKKLVVNTTRDPGRTANKANGDGRGGEGRRKTRRPFSESSN